MLDATLPAQGEDTLLASQRLLESLLLESSPPSDGNDKTTALLFIMLYTTTSCCLFSVSEEESDDSDYSESNVPLFLVANKVDLLQPPSNGNRTTSPIVDSLASSLSQSQNKVVTHYISCSSGAGLQAS